MSDEYDTGFPDPISDRIHAMSGLIAQLQSEKVDSPLYKAGLAIIEMGVLSIAPTTRATNLSQIKGGKSSL